MSNSDWPSWHPGLELTANHLFALEDYLIERSRLIDKSHGVINFNWQKSLYLQEENDLYTLIVKNIQGITRGGYPVRLDRTTLADTLNDLDSQFYIYIEILVCSGNTEDHTPLTEKQQVLIKIKEQDSEVAASSNLLYLGCYEIIDDALKQINRPIPRCMVDLKIDLDDWQSWCSPLIGKFQAFRDYLENFSNNDMYAQAAFKEFVSLSIEWPVLPIVKLIHKLVRVQQMIELITNSESINYERITVYTDNDHFSDIENGDELPNRLASFLGDIPKIPWDQDQTGRTIQSSYRDEQLYTVESVLTSSVGNCYRVKPLNHQSDTMEMVWLPPENSSEIRSNLNELIRLDPGKQFIWLNDMVYSDFTPGIGYIKPLPDSGMIDIEDFFSGDDISARMTTTAVINLIKRFIALNENNLFFSRMDTDSIFVNPVSGEVLLGFADNIVSSRHGETVGNPEYLPPQALYNVANLQGNHHFLAVLIFKLFMGKSPFFDGEVKDVSEYDFGYDQYSDSVFIFDPENEINRSDNNYQQNIYGKWDGLPDDIKEKFIHSFTERLANSNHRVVLEQDWLKTVSSARDSIVYCSHCNVDNYYCKEWTKPEGTEHTCWQCKSRISIPPRLLVNELVIVLSDGAQIYPHHINRQAFDFSSPLAQVETVENGPDNGHLVLKNLSTVEWDVSVKNKSYMVRVGHRLNLQYSWNINFGTTQGLIENWNQA